MFYLPNHHSVSFSLIVLQEVVRLRPQLLSMSTSEFFRFFVEIYNVFT